MMTVDSRRWRSTAAFFAAGVLLASGVASSIGLLASASAEPARAADKPECVKNGDHGQVAAIEAPHRGPSRHIRGTKGKVWIAPRGTHCQRISSLYVFSSSFKGVFEFGYVVGYSNCSHHTYRKPTLFSWAHSTRGGRLKCHVWPNRHPDSGQSDTFTASDKNGNKFWGGYFNGHQLQPKGVKLNFDHGWSALGMERGSNRDGGHAEFHKLREYHYDSDWSRWDRLTRTGDTDPQYHLRRLNHHAGNVVHD